MPKNKGKGGKNRRRGKNENDNEKRELTFKEDGQEYAQVVKMLGNGRLEALCFDGEKRLAHIRGKLRKKVWINQGDIILLSLRDYQDEKGDVILKYTADEARNLKAYGELPESAKINEGTFDIEGMDECGVDFGLEGEDDDDDNDSDVDIDRIWSMLSFRSFYDSHAAFSYFEHDFLCFYLLECYVDGAISNLCYDGMCVHFLYVFPLQDLSGKREKRRESRTAYVMMLMHNAVQLYHALNFTKCSISLLFQLSL